MLSLELSTIGLSLALFAVAFLALWALAAAKAAEKYTEECVEFVNSDPPDRVSLARIAEIELTLTELTDSYDALLSSHKKLRARIGMRATRERRKLENEPEINDLPQTDAEKAEWKRVMRAKLRANGQLK